MGNILDKPAASVPDLHVNLESTQPAPGEAELFDQLLRDLHPAGHILQQLRGYKGCGDQIRVAISQPTPQSEQEAWAAVIPAVETLRQFFEFSLVLENTMPCLLSVLCVSASPVPPDHIHRSIESHPGLTRLFADVLAFVFEFDDLKMSTPSIQNDFSYYRRTMNRLRMQSTQNMQSVQVLGDDLANRMSLFYAYHTPMMKAVTDSTSNAIGTRTVNQNNVSEFLAAICGVCYHGITKRRVQRPETIGFMLRVMVATALLYDHVHPQGVFIKTSPIPIKNIIKAVQAEGEIGNGPLLNALRFSSRHLQDESTPKSVRQLLGS